MLIELHPAADAELWAAIDWYDRQEPELGDHFEAAIYEALGQIADSPRAWKPWPEDSAVRIFSLRRFPFHLPYALDGSRIIVLAVAHAKREPGYWRERVSSDDGSR